MPLYWRAWVDCSYVLYLHTCMMSYVWSNGRCMMSYVWGSDRCTPFNMSMVCFTAAYQWYPCKGIIIIIMGLSQIPPQIALSQAYTEVLLWQCDLIWDIIWYYHSDGLFAGNMKLAHSHCFNLTFPAHYWLKIVERGSASFLVITKTKKSRFALDSARGWVFRVRRNATTLCGSYTAQLNNLSGTASHNHWYGTVISFSCWSLWSVMAGLDCGVDFCSS